MSSRYLTRLWRGDVGDGGDDGSQGLDIGQERYNTISRFPISP